MPAWARRTTEPPQAFARRAARVRPAPMPLFFFVALALWLLLHVYIARRLVAPLSARWLRGFLYVGWLLLWGLAPLGFWLNDKLAPPHDLGMRSVVWTYVGAFTLLFA